MGKHKEYSEDLCNSVVNAVNNLGITKVKAPPQFGVSKQLVCTWFKIKAHRGTLETKPRSSRPRKTTEWVVSFIKCQKVMLALLHCRLLLNITNILK